MSGKDESDNKPEINQDSTEIYKKLSKVFKTLESKGLIVKNAGVGSVRSDYVRGDDLIKSFKENIDYLVKEVNSILNVNIKAEDPNAPQLVYNMFNQRNMMKKAGRYPDDPKMKYPKRLIPFQEEGKCCSGHHEGHEHKNSKVADEEKAKLEEKMFYLVNIEEDKKKTFFWLSVAIFAVIMVCLFPVWPIEVKIGIYYVSYFFLVGMLTLLFARLTIFIFFYTFGVDFWLFPNLLDDKLGVIDSFKPLYSVAKRTETALTVLFRISVTLFVCYLAYIVYDNPSIMYDFRDHIVDIYVDTFDYGKDKVINWGVSQIIILLF